MPDSVPLGWRTLSLDLNRAIAELLTRLNDRVMRHVKQSRRLYERLDRPALKALPAHPYEYAEWKQVGVNIDYHVSFDDHFYSVPYTLVGESLWCRATGRTIELIHQGKRITSRVRSFVKYDYSAHPEHRPASHRAHLEWTPAPIAIRRRRAARTRLRPGARYPLTTLPHHQDHAQAAHGGRTAPRIRR